MSVAVEKKIKQAPDWQQGKRPISAWVDDSQYVAVNRLRIDQRCSVRDLVEEALTDLLIKHSGARKIVVPAVRSKADVVAEIQELVAELARMG